MHSNDNSGGDADQDGDVGPQSDLSKRVQLTLATVQGIEGYDYTNGYGHGFTRKVQLRFRSNSIKLVKLNERLNIWINSGDMPRIYVSMIISMQRQAM